MNSIKKKKQRIIRRKLFNLFYVCTINKFITEKEFMDWMLRIPYSEYESKKLETIESFWEYVNDLEKLIVEYEKDYPPVESHGFLSFIKLHPEQDDWKIK